MLGLIYKKIFCYGLNAARVGRLKFVLPDQSELAFGDREAEPVTVQICSMDFFKRVIRDGGIGLGEAYTDLLWSTDDLTGFLSFLIDNKKYFDVRLRPFKGAGHVLNAVLHALRRNTVENSAKNIQQHYDLSNDFFALFLDSTMTYSCAVFQHDGQSLEAAQKNKIRKLAERIAIGSNDHVLEIGCGWGGFALQTVSLTGCRWTGLTLSKEQKKMAEQRILEAGLTDKIQIQLTDYRQAQGTYDKVVSIEMIEAVGHEYLGLYFDSCAQFLKRGGKMALQAITIPQERYEDYRRNCDWIQKHIFPGGHLPSLELIQSLASRAGLKILGVESIGLDYAKTLSVWCEALLGQKEKLLKMGYDESFLRKWQYYFCYCESGFRAGLIDDVQVVLERV